MILSQNPEAPTDDAITGAGLTPVSGEVKASSWYQRIALTLTNHYSQSVDINQLKLGFTATAHPDPYSPFSGTMLGNQAVTLASDGGWPIEKNTITINNDGEYLLASGKSAMLEFYLSATQTPVALSDLTATLAHDPGRRGQIIVQFPAQAQSTLAEAGDRTAVSGWPPAALCRRMGRFADHWRSERRKLRYYGTGIV